MLDVNPFTQDAVADSLIDVWTEITVGDQVLHTGGPLRLETTIGNEPPTGGERYVNPFLVRVELIDPVTGEGTGIFIDDGLNPSDNHDPHSLALTSYLAATK